MVKLTPQQKTAFWHILKECFSYAPMLLLALPSAWDISNAFGIIEAPCFVCASAGAAFEATYIGAIILRHNNQSHKFISTVTAALIAAVFFNIIHAANELDILWGNGPDQRRWFVSVGIGLAFPIVNFFYAMLIHEPSGALPNGATVPVGFFWRVKHFFSKQPMQPITINNTAQAAVLPPPIDYDLITEKTIAAIQPQLVILNEQWEWKIKQLVATQQEQKSLSTAHAVLLGDTQPAQPNVSNSNQSQQPTTTPTKTRSTAEIVELLVDAKPLDRPERWQWVQKVKATNPKYSLAQIGLALNLAKTTVSDLVNAAEPVAKKEKEVMQQ